MADQQQGFSLIETLVALALLALVTGAVYSSYTISMTGAEESARTALATRFAQSKLEEFSVGGLVEAGERRGESGDGFSWLVTVSPMEDEDTVAGGALGGSVQQAALVEVTVAWQGQSKNRSVALTTVRLTGAGGGR